MFISPEPETTHSSSAPFAEQNATSANPFDTYTQDSRPVVLVVEDDADLSRVLCVELQANGLDTVPAFSGDDALAMLAERRFGLVLLDWQLPGCTGIAVLKSIRQHDDRTPVFLMSGLDRIENRVCAFESGADDFLVKPFALPELLARVRARLRRARTAAALQWWIGDLALCVEPRRVVRAGQEIALTPREFDVLLYLLQQRPRVVTREMLCQEIWRVSRRTASLDNGIDVHIAHLRRKVDADHTVKLIHTVRGKGFMVYEDGAVPVSRRLTPAA
jgi:two-component system, OmpR family, copper resistance phosphate regulon response regulator CusR